MARNGELEVWRGCVNAWECDELGHMNVRFYLARAFDGLARLAATLGQPRAFAPEATATLQISHQHVRFLREAKPGASLHMTGGLVEMHEDGALILQVLHHHDGQPCAAILSRVLHATPLGRPFPWPARALDAAPGLAVATPEFAAPRNFTGQEPSDPEACWEPDLEVISMGPVSLRECDVFGYMTPDTVLGRISDGMNVLTAPIYAELEILEPGRRLNTAALEYRIDHLERPRVGDLVEVRSRIAGVAEKLISVEHWLCDPVGRRVWARARGIHANFDLDARKTAPIPARVRERFAAI
jgi:acyl-CoA thioester hydrolase